MKRLEDEIEKRSRTKPYPSKTKLSNKLGVAKKTISRGATKLKRQDKVVERKRGRQKIYAWKKHYEKDYYDSLEAGFNKLDNVLNGIRKPTKREVIEEVQFDPDNPAVRENFYKLKKNKDWREPSEEEVEESKFKLREFIQNGIVSRNGWGAGYRDDEFRKKFEDYYERNSNILEKLEISLVSDEDEPSRAHFSYPEELRKLVGRTESILEF